LKVSPLPWLNRRRALAYRIFQLNRSDSLPSYLYIVPYPDIPPVAPVHFFPIFGDKR
jgi:hypothetical protein